MDAILKKLGKCLGNYVELETKSGYKGEGFLKHNLDGTYDLVPHNEKMKKIPSLYANQVKDVIEIDRPTSL